MAALQGKRESERGRRPNNGCILMPRPLSTLVKQSYDNRLLMFVYSLNDWQ